MDHAMKECETEANTPLPPPLSSTLCSQLTQNQNTQETYPRYSQQDLNARKKNGTCLRCKQQGHWYWECPLIKSSTTIPNTPRTYGVAVAIAVAKENLKESEKPPQGVLCLPHKKLSNRAKDLAVTRCGRMSCYIIIKALCSKA
ncbi:hypothetical protein GLYMA_16G046651v4 [Glycine max]|nr:hypothetical protein GLYMA_16G046651v4 [Glycine max]KAH1149987.1 hypothetical protein GYH30_044151 [Glycine max]